MDEVYSQAVNTSRDDVYSTVKDKPKSKCLLIANVVMIIANVMLSSTALAASLLRSCEQQTCTNSQTTTAATVLRECPENYAINPYAKSCLQLVEKRIEWADAKAYCEERGEHLATFETLESMFFYINLRKMNSAWRKGSVWLGGNKTDTNEWRWQGKTTEEIVQGVWSSEEPNDHKDRDERCLASWMGFDYLLNDQSCNSTLRFVCERVI